MSAKDTAIELRKKGYSYNYIARATGLSISTLSYHLSKIPYSPNKETIDTIGKARAASSFSKSETKRKTFNVAREQAKKDVEKLSQRDVLMLGIGLYIGEGSKTQDLVRLVNVDHRVINLFITWMKSFGLDCQNFVIRIHLYPDSNILEAENFWIRKTGLDRKQFQKPCIDTRAGKSRKRNAKYPYGTAHVTVKSNGNKDFGVILARKIGALMEEVLK